MEKEIDHQELAFELDWEYQKYIQSKVYDKDSQLTGIILSTIYEESIADLVFKVLKVNNENEYKYIVDKIDSVKDEIYSNLEKDPYDSFNELYLDLAYELDQSDNNLFFIKRSDLSFSNKVKLKVNIKNSCYYSDKEDSVSYGNIKITSGLYEGEIGYYDDDDRDEEGRPCGIIYLGELFQSSYILVPYGNFQVTCENNKNTDKFAEKNKELSQQLGIVNLKLN